MSTTQEHMESKMPDAPVSPSASPGRILVVDDVPTNRSVLERLLRLQKYVVESVGDGESALEAIARRPPDIVLLDVQMPGLDGFEVCRRIKQRPATCLIPVVFMTGLSDRASRIQGIEAGGDDFLRKPFDVEELGARVRSLLRIKRYTDDLECAESVIVSLALTVEARDPYTEGHCQRLAQYATGLGAEIGLCAEDLAALQRGGFLHDVGKIGISDAILFKQGRLTSAEYETMKQHTVIGDRLCGNLRSLAPVRAIVRHHHEAIDGSGYPDGLRGDEIPLLAQIVRIVDTYDAITTTRPYRTALPPAHAFSELRSEVAQGHCSADLVEVFISRMSRLLLEAKSEA
jgi:putative two-component system response regulator